MKNAIHRSPQLSQRIKNGTVLSATSRVKRSAVDLQIPRKRDFYSYGMRTSVLSSL